MYNDFSSKGLFFTLRSRYGSSLEMRSKLIEQGNGQYMFYFVKFFKDGCVIYASFVDHFKEEEKFLRAADQAIKYILWEFDNLVEKNRDGCSILEKIIIDKLKFDTCGDVKVKSEKLKEHCYKISKEGMFFDYLKNIENKDLSSFLES